MNTQKSIFLAIMAIASLMGTSLNAAAHTHGNTPCTENHSATTGTSYTGVRDGVILMLANTIWTEVYTYLKNQATGSASHTHTSSPHEASIQAQRAHIDDLQKTCKYWATKRRGLDEKNINYIRYTTKFNKAEQRLATAENELTDFIKKHAEAVLKQASSGQGQNTQALAPHSHDTCNHKH